MLRRTLRRGSELESPRAKQRFFVPGAFESVVNARWSHVLSGEAGMPLGMRVDGLPENVWSYDEVNYSPWPLEVDRQAPRNGNLEIMGCRPRPAGHTRNSETKGEVLTAMLRAVKRIVE
ncbi:putative Retrotransposon hot spot protein [Trypanosoma vivax]|nr:putative Retrotransposon hot spot protein [Trypanosoma vivax]